MLKLRFYEQNKRLCFDILTPLGLSILVTGIKYSSFSATSRRIYNKEKYISIVLNIL